MNEPLTNKIKIPSNRISENSGPSHWPDLPDFNDSTQIKPANLLENLNDQQRQAVIHGDGPLLVLAGAGTGKTRVLTHRLAYRIVHDHVEPSQIMAVTFTNKAAKEMRHRLERLLQRQGLGSMMLGTFHALSARIIRRNAELVDRTPSFTIIDTDDQLRLIKKILIEKNYGTTTIPPRKIAHNIDAWKNRLLLPEHLSAREIRGETGQISLEVYKLYQHRLAKLNCLDFGDLLMLCIVLFRKSPDVLSYWQNRLHHILVDEYQDTNHAQEVMLRLLAAKHKNICCVGDEDQAIYSWRGADVRHILEFQKHYPNASIIKLEQNYRSTSQILHVASSLIKHNTERLDKTLHQQDNKKNGTPVRVFFAHDSDDEASSIIRSVHEWRDSGQSLSEVTILVRVAAQTRIFEDVCLKTGLPYIIFGGMRFYEREEIRDCIAYLRLTHQPRDDLAFERIINKPPRGIGNAAQAAISTLAREQDIPMIEAMRILVRTDELRTVTRNACHKFLTIFDTWSELSKSASATTLLERILDESGYSVRLNKNDDLSGETRLENVKELLGAMEEFNDLPMFLEHVSLVMDNDRQKQSQCLNIMTIHSAKGLEFDRVYLPGWEDGLIPHERSLQEGNPMAVEEERRLAYVAITRARKELIISCARRRLIQGTWRSSYPSRFFDEIPRESLDVSMFTLSQQQTDEQPQTPPVIPAPTIITWRADMPCWHPKFGLGKIMHVSSDDFVTASFPSGKKTTLANYLQPIKDEDEA